MNDRLDHLYSEAVQAWEKSRENLAPDTDCLNAAMSALDRKAKLWGLWAPKEIHKHSTSETPTVSISIVEFVQPEPELLELSPVEEIDNAKSNGRLHDGIG